MGEIRHVPLIILGLGNVGPVLLGQVLDTRDVLAKRTGLRITPIGLADSGTALLEPDGLSDSSFPAALSAKNDRRSLGTLAERRPRSLVAKALQKDAILVDMTASTKEEPLVISVPGAGPEVPATGVLGDIIDIGLLRTS